MKKLNTISCSILLALSIVCLVLAFIFDDMGMIKFGIIVLFTIRCCIIEDNLNDILEAITTDLKGGDEDD